MTRGVTIGGFVVIAAAVLVAQVVAVRRRHLATLPTSIRAAVRSPAARWLLLLAWLWLGWHLFARADHP